MKILLAVPSKNRAETLSRFSLPWLLKMEHDLAVFVEPQDEQVYGEIPLNFQKKNATLITIPENNRGLGYVKQQIQDYALKNGYDLVFKIDDDTAGFSDYRIRSKTPADTVIQLTKAFDKILPMFQRHEALYAVGFPYDFQMFSLFEFEPAKKLQSSYLVRPEWLTAGDFSTFEDFSVGINILVNGGKILKYGKTGQQVGVQVGKGTGGCQDFDRAAQAQIEAKLLQKLYPPLTFRKVLKPWKIEPDMRSLSL